MQKNYAMVSALVFAVVAVVQVLRLVNQWAVQVGPYAVPLWFSWIAVIVAAALSFWGFRNATR
jgi:hypothetical protein